MKFKFLTRLIQIESFRFVKTFDGSKLTTRSADVVIKTGCFDRSLKGYEEMVVLFE